MRITTSVYLIGNVEHNVFKIGIADDVNRRLKQLATACPYSLSVLTQHDAGARDAALEVEAKLHEIYTAQGQRIRPDGEWFVNVTVEDFTRHAELATDRKYLKDYTWWYFNTGQTRGNHPVDMSIKMTTQPMCVFCYSEGEHFTLMATSESKDKSWYCKEHGEYNTEELKLYRHIQRSTLPIPMEHDFSAIPTEMDNIPI